MSVTYKEELILANVLTTIQGIDGEGDYYLDLEDRVYRKWLDPSVMDKANFPYACIMDISDTQYLPLTGKEYTTGTTRQGITDGWDIGVWIYVSVGDDVDNEGLLQKELIYARADMIIAMLADEKRDSNALSTALTGMSKRVDWNLKFGGVAGIFTIKYDFDPTATNPVA